MGWPLFENKKGWSVKDLHAQLWKAMSPYAFIDVAINPTNKTLGCEFEGQLEEIQHYMKLYDIPVDKIRIHAIPHFDI